MTWARTKGLGLLILVAVGARVAAGLLLGHFTDPVAWEYEEIASNLLAGRGFVYEHLGTPYRAFVAPLYPLWCGLIYLLTNQSQLAVLLLQCGVSALACVQVRAIGTLVLADPNPAALGAWLLAFHPGLVFYASTLHPLTMDVAVFLWALWAWLRFLRRPTWGGAGHAGISSGVALLSRASLGPFVLLAMVWFLRYATLTRSQVGRRLAVAMTVAGLLVMPWLIRNAAHFHQFPVYQTNAGEIFWRGNNAAASGGSYLPDGRTVLSTAPEAFHRRLAELDESGQNQLFFEEAVKFIRAHPLSALRLYGKKIWIFWWFADQTGGTYAPGYRLGYSVFYTLVASLAVVGLWGLRRMLGRPEIILVVGFMLSVALTQSLYYVEGRHRWTVEPVLLLFSAAGAHRVLGRVRRRRPSA